MAKHTRPRNHYRRLTELNPNKRSSQHETNVVAKRKAKQISFGSTKKTKIWTAFSTNFPQQKLSTTKPNHCDPFHSAERGENQGIQLRQNEARLRAGLSWTSHGVKSTAKNASPCPKFNPFVQRQLDSCVLTNQSKKSFQEVAIASKHSSSDEFI
jgi:hypothetical protein